MAGYSFDGALGGLFIPKSSVGLYSLAFTLAWTPADKVTSLILRVVPAVLGNVRDNRQEVARYFLNITAVIAVIAFPMFAGLALVGPDIVRVFLAPQWAGVATIMIPFCLFGIISETLSLVPHVLVTLGETRVLNRTLLASTFVMPALFTALAWKFGPVGLATAWPVGALLLSYPTMRHALLALDLDFAKFVAVLRMPALATIGMSLTVWRLGQWIDRFSLPPAARLAILILSGSVAYIVAVFLVDRRRAVHLLQFAQQVRRRAG
jgi:O-antigen/teichoic acid export membrane protein